MKIDDLFEQGSKMHDIFKMEHFYQYDDMALFRDQMNFFCRNKILKSSQNETYVEPEKSEIALKTLDFFV